MRYILVIVTLCLSHGVHASCEPPFFPAYRCAQRDEADLLEKYPQIAVRSEGTLILSLKNGKTLELRDTDTDNPNAKLYTIVRYLPEIGFGLVHVAHWEGGTYYLVSLANGNIDDVRGIPVVSPDRKRIVTSVFAGISGFFKTTINIYSLVDNTLQIEWQYEPRKWEPSDLEWTSDSRIEFTRNFFSQALLLEHQNERMAYTREPGQIELHGSEWVLR